jgi:Tfp pilus assembly protein PilO
MTPKQYNFIILSVIGGLLVAGAAGYIYAFNLINQSSQSLAVQLGKASVADEQISNLKLTKQTYTQKIVPILPEIEAAMPKTKNQTELLAQLQDAAVKSGISISSVSFAAVQDKLPSNTTQTTAANGMLIMPVSFSVEGSFTQLQAFLGRVESLKRITAVTNLTVTRSGSSIVYAMTVNSFIKP